MPPPPRKTAPLSQQKQVTLLHLDNAPLSARRPDDWPAQVTALVGRYGGTVVGPAHEGEVVALFGVPTAHENDARQAVRAALALQHEAAPFLPLVAHLPAALEIVVVTETVLLRPDEPDLPAVAATLLPSARAARRQLAGPGVVVDRATYRLTRDWFHMKPLDPDEAEAQHFTVRRARLRSFRVPPGVEGSTEPLIGRVEEFHALRQVFHDVVQQAHLRLVTIEGETGVGKSRLLYEFTRWLEEQPETVRFFRGRVNPQTGQQPYALVRDFFAYRFGIQEQEAPTSARTKLEQGIRGVMPTDGTAVAHVIGHLLGFEYEDSPYLRRLHDDARLLRDRAFESIVQFFREKGASRAHAVRLMPSSGSTLDRPVVVLLLEDVHWTDGGSLELIDYLVHAARDLPMLIICLARPLLWERFPDWARAYPAAVHLHLTLHPLATDESQRLAATLLRRVGGASSDLARLLVERAEGNPFYMEEMIKMLVEERVIVTPEESEREEWAVETERLTSTPVPPTLTGVLQSRLDALRPVERETIQRAAIVGRLFWDRAVMRLFGEDSEARDAVRDALDALQRKGLIIERQPFAFKATREFVFKHALMQEVVYASVAPPRRQRYHARVAAWLVEWSGASDRWAGQIAEHYERAGERQAAASWYGRAAAYARHSHVPGAAIGLYRKAMAFLQMADAAEPAAQAEIRRQQIAYYEGLGDVLLQQAHYREAIEVYAAMRGTAEAAGDVLALVRGWTLSTLVYDTLGDLPAFRHSAEQAERVLRAYEAAGNVLDEALQVELAVALSRQGWALFRSGQAEAARARAQQASELCRALGPVAQREMAFSQQLTGMVHMMTGHYLRADHHLRESLRSFEAVGDRRWVGRAWNGLGENARIQGNYERAARHYRRALEIAEEIGNRDWALIYRSNLGGALVGMADPTGAERLLREVLDDEGSRGTGSLSKTYRFLAEALLAQGRLAEARQAAQQALQRGEQSEQPAFIGAAWRVLGLVGARDGADPNPATCFERSLLVFAEIGMEGERARTLRDWAHYESTQGDTARGLAMWQAAYDLFLQLDMPEEAERMKKA